jgi:hypothetical protein
VTTTRLENTGRQVGKVRDATAATERFGRRLYVGANVGRVVVLGSGDHGREIDVRFRRPPPNRRGGGDFAGPTAG